MNQKIKTFFWNSPESRLRSGWRILFTTVGTLIVFFPIQAALKWIVPKDLPKDQSIDILISVFADVITFTLCFARKYIDKRSFSSMGVQFKKGIFHDIIAGYTISAILVATVIMVEISFGWLSFETTKLEWSVLLVQLLYLFIVTGLVVAWWENLFFVSYLFINFKDGCGFWCSYIVVCLIFGLIHSFNPSASVWSFAGIVLIHSYEIFAFLRRKNIWLVLGIHAGWNTFQGLAGFSVSGQSNNQVIKQTNITPAWLGGGEFGPEAGLIIVFVGIIAFTLIWFYSQRVNKNIAESKGI